MPVAGAGSGSTALSAASAAPAWWGSAVFAAWEAWIVLLLLAVAMTTGISYDEDQHMAHPPSPDMVEAGVSMFSATRHLERIADHATNIAEDVVYLVEGEIIRHRPSAMENE